jgi:cell division transport system permease protein
MFLALFMLGSLFFMNVILTTALESFESKLDVSVDFKLDAPEDDILNLKASLESFSEVDKVEYVSRDEALARFKERYKDNALITQSLEEIGTNPLPASLNIKAKDPENYGTITTFLKNDSLSVLIDEIRENQPVIESLTRVLRASQIFGLGITIALASIAILVTFNTIRLAIYTSRDEITIMRLVGATNAYIRGPFLVEGVIHGILATIAVMAIFWPLLIWLGPKAADFFDGPDLHSYYLSNLPVIFLLHLAAGVILGVISSSIATRRYLKEHK